MFGLILLTMTTLVACEGVRRSLVEYLEGLDLEQA